MLALEQELREEIQGLSIGTEYTNITAFGLGHTFTGGTMDDTSAGNLDRIRNILDGEGADTSDLNVRVALIREKVQAAHSLLSAKAGADTQNLWL